MRPNSVLHKGLGQMDLHGTLQQIRSTGSSVDATDKQAVRAMVIDADRLLHNRANTPSETVGLSWSATKRWGGG